MQTQAAEIPIGSNLRSLRCVSGIRSLQTPMLTTQQNSETRESPVTLRSSSLQQSPDSALLEFSSRVVQNAASPLSARCTLQEARQSPSPKPQLLQPASVHKDIDFARRVSMLRRQGSRRPKKHRTRLIGTSGLVKKFMPVRRHTSGIRKPSMSSLKVQRTIRTTIKKLLYRMPFSRERPVVRTGLVLSSSAAPINKVPQVGHMAAVKCSASINGASPFGAKTRASGAIGDKDHPHRSSAETPESREAILLHEAREDNHGLRLEIIRLQRETARIEARRERDMARLAARQAEEVSHYLEQNLQLREALGKDIVSMAIRDDYFGSRYKVQIKQLEDQIEQLEDQIKQLKDQLEADLVKERIKSSYHLAHHEHFKMIYNMECQARTTTVDSSVTSPVAPTEDDLWGTLRNIQNSIYLISSRVETLELKNQPWQEPKPGLLVTSDRVPISVPAVTTEASNSVSRQNLRANTAQEDNPIEVSELQDQRESNPPFPATAAAPRRADIVSSSSVEADDPSIQPGIATVLSSASKEKHSYELRLLALRQLLPRIHTSRFHSTSTMADSSSSWSTVTSELNSTELAISTAFLPSEPDAENKLTSHYSDSVSNVSIKDDNENENDSDDEDEEFTNPKGLLDLSISLPTIPISPLTYPPSLATSSLPSPTSPTTPLCSSSTRPVSAVSPARCDRISTSSENGDSEREDSAEDHSDAEMYRTDQAVIGRDEKGNDGMRDVDIAKFLLGAGQWDSVPRLDLVDFSYM